MIYRIVKETVNDYSEFYIQVKRVNFFRYLFGDWYWVETMHHDQPVRAFFPNVQAARDYIEPRKDSEIVFEGITLKAK